MDNVEIKVSRIVFTCSTCDFKSKEDETEIVEVFSSEKDLVWLKSIGDIFIIR